jgi:N-acetylglucosamine-6-phosphate deacetylase
MKTESGARHNRFSVQGKLLVGDSLVPGAVIVEGDSITEVRTGGALAEIPEPVLEAAFVSPGLIDLQVNGGFGLEVGDDPAALAALAAQLPETGVTAFLPTLVSSDAATYRAAAAALATIWAAPGARRLGLHLEGPLLAPARAGAHDRARIAGGAATLTAVLDELLVADVLRLVTLAPELPGALDLIRRLRSAGVTVSLGHTDASFDEMLDGIEAGAALVTHLFNAMSAFHHRSPSAAGAALIDDRVAVSLIADGVHTHPAALNLALRAKGAARIALVTDAVSAAGGPPGTYTLGGAPVISDGIAARLPDGTLAGSTLTLDGAVRNMVSFGGARRDEALAMATAVPAGLLGRADLGRLAPGCAADLVLWDADLQVEATFIAGRRAFSATSPIG